MDHPDEHTLELLILEPERFSSTARGGLAMHIADCGGCRNLFETLEGLHRGLRSDVGVSPDVTARAVHRIFCPGNIIRLLPYHPHPKTPVGESYAGVLAAMSPAVDMHKGYETVATFASETDHMLLRVRQDAARRKVKLYYLTDDAAKRTGPVITLPVLGAEAVLDEHGQSEFDIPEPKSAREWASLEVLVSLPAYALTWTRGSEGQTPTDGGGDASYRIILHEKDGTVSFECRIAPGAPGIRRAVVWSPEGNSILVEVTDGRGSFTDPSPGDPLLIRLYA
jgi:hypothetical protein